MCCLCRYRLIQPAPDFASKFESAQAKFDVSVRFVRVVRHALGSMMDAPVERLAFSVFKPGVQGTSNHSYSVEEVASEAGFVMEQAELLLKDVGGVV
jgi:hypothetical protein